MTNSHSRNGRNAGSGSHAERYFHNHSPQQLSPSVAQQHPHQQQQQHQQQQYQGGAGGVPGGNGGGKQQRGSNNHNGGGSGGRGQRSPSANYFRSILATSNAIPIVQQPQRQPSSSPTGGRGSRHGNSSSSPNGISFNQRSSPSNGGSFAAMMSSPPAGTAGAPVSGSPPNFSHFAGSKCYDAPAPTALPKPPVHWTNVGGATGPSVASSLSTMLVLAGTASGSAPAAGSKKGSAAGSSSLNGVLKQHHQQQQQQPRLRTKAMKSCASAAAKASNRHDAIFTHNLKAILNVQA